jgi:ribosomal protein RSM22 (predicted rRNA methylase)
MRVLSELRRLAPQVEISSLLDLGAGPGTALFAAAEIFPSLTSATLLEADPQWLHLKKELGDHLRGG